MLVSVLRDKELVEKFSALGRSLVKGRLYEGLGVSETMLPVGVLIITVQIKRTQSLYFSCYSVFPCVFYK